MLIYVMLIHQNAPEDTVHAIFRSQYALDDQMHSVKTIVLKQPDEASFVYFVLSYPHQWTEL